LKKFEKLRKRLKNKKEKEEGWLSHPLATTILAKGVSQPLS
jgi:hypothetical protein